jgi:hypothetical protein
MLGGRWTKKVYYVPSKWHCVQQALEEVVAMLGILSEKRKSMKLWVQCCATWITPARK